jgi:hypothetical protein
MPVNRVSRRAALGGVLVAACLLAGCGGGGPPPSFAPLGWDYLPPLKLNVGAIDIDDSWTPRAAGRERGNLAPVAPVAALRQMAEDRLIAGGTSGRAVFVIDDASITQSRDIYVGSFVVHLDISSADGGNSGYAQARVARSRSIKDDSPDRVRAELYDMVKQMMTDMNVEFEYQVRHGLRDYLQTTSPSAPGPGPVERQDLAPPGGVPETRAAPSVSAVPPLASPVPLPSPGLGQLRL